MRLTARTAYAERSALLVAALRERGMEPGIAPDGLNLWIETAVGDAARAVRVTSSTITLEQAAAFVADLAEAR